MNGFFEIPLLLIWSVFLFMILFWAVRQFRLFSALRRLSPVSREPLSGDDVPFVTVQLPIRNEKNVVRGLLAAVFRLDYPGDRLEIQVLDDSDDCTSSIIDEMVTAYEGDFSVNIIRRKEARGFKAGALATGLGEAKGEFIAIFDADSAPDADFLRVVLPSLLGDSRVGMAQACFRFRNRNKNLLTRLQALLLESHMYVDQWVSSLTGQPFQFNGTAGVWSRRCLEDCGGWAFASLTEDLEISFRALSRQWRFVQIPEISVETELPETMGSYRLQQNRWACGAAQVFMELFKSRIWKDRRDWPRVFFYAGRKSIFLFFVAYALALPFLRHSLIFGVTALFLCLAFVSFLLCVYQSQRLLGRDGKEVLRLALPMGSLVVGLSFSLAISFLRGLLESEGEFERTPKGGEKPIGCWYQPTMDGSYFLEIFIPLFYVAVLAINRDSPWFLELSVAWVATAFFSVGVSTLRSFSARSESWSP